MTQAIRILLYIFSGMFFGIGIWYFVLSKTKRIRIPKTEKIKDLKSGIVFAEDGAIIAGDQIGEYKVSDIVNSINEFTKSFNSTNKKANIASGIISILSSATLLISAVIL